MALRPGKSFQFQRYPCDTKHIPKAGTTCWGDLLLRCLIRAQGPAAPCDIASWAVAQTRSFCWRLPSSRFLPRWNFCVLLLLYTQLLEGPGESRRRDTETATDSTRSKKTQKEPLQNPNAASLAGRCLGGPPGVLRANRGPGRCARRYQGELRPPISRVRLRTSL